jgi:CheY-like chemotaxis protein
MLSYVQPTPSGQRLARRALLVDDNNTTSTGYQRKLAKDGYEVITASDPEAALALIKQSQPNVIFVHIGSKGSGNSDFIVRLRAGDDTRHIPVAVLTSYYNAGLEKVGLNPMSREDW